MPDPLTIGMAGAGALSGLLKGGNSGQDKLARISEKEFVRRSTIEDEDRARKLAQDKRLLPVRQQLLQALAGKLGLSPEIMSLLGGGGEAGDRQLGDLPMRGPMPIGGTVNLGPGPAPGPVPLGGRRPMNDLPMRPPMTVGGGDRQFGDLPMRRPSTLDDFGQEQEAGTSPLRKLLAGRLGMQR